MKENSTWSRSFGHRGIDIKTVKNKRKLINKSYVEVFAERSQSPWRLLQLD